MTLIVFSWQNKATVYNYGTWVLGIFGKNVFDTPLIYFKIASVFPNWFAPFLSLFFHGRTGKHGEMETRFKGSIVWPTGKDWVGSEPDVHAAHLAFVHT